MRYAKFLRVGWPTLLLCICATPALLAPQKARRLVEVMRPLGGPVEITAIKVRGVTLPPEGNISEEKDWIDDVSFVVKNVSSTPVVFVEVQILTRKIGASEESGTGGELGIAQAIYGDRPNANGEFSEALVPIPPGGEAEVHLPIAYGKLTEFTQKIPEVPQDISRLHVFVGMVVHEGDPDTMWYQHKRLRRKKKGSNDFVLDESPPAKREGREESSP